MNQPQQSVPYVVALEAVNDQLRARIAELERELAKFNGLPEIDVALVPLKFGLTPAQTRLMALLLKGGIASKRDLVSVLANGKPVRPSFRVIDVHITNIRRKVEGFDIVIESSRGRGYKIGPDSMAKIVAIQTGTDIAMAG